MIANLKPQKLVGMKIPDVILRKRREDVSVDKFFQELAASLDDPKGDPFSILIHLVQNGLKFAAGPSGSVRENHQVDQGHVLDAINEARKAEVITVSNAKVKIKTPTDNEYEQQLLYRLYVNRENTKQVYHALGYPSFPWPKEDIESVDFDLGWEISKLEKKLENVRAKSSKTSEGEKWKTERMEELKKAIAELWDFQLPESGYVNTTREPSEKVCQHTSSENITSTPLPREKAKSLPHGDQPLIGFQLDRSHWRVTFSGQTEIVKTTNGMHYYKCLIDHPLQTFSGFQLKKLVLGETMDSDVTDEQAKQSRLEIIENPGDCGETLDPQAITEYKGRMEAILKQKEIAETTDNKARLAELEGEEQEIADHLRKNTNYRGKPRIFRSPYDNARSAVSHALSVANKNIGKQHSKAAEYLRNHIKTDQGFCFQPDPPDSPA